jgi:flagellar biosynthesis GTPase FlhF
MAVSKKADKNGSNEKPKKEKGAVSRKLERELEDAEEEVEEIEEALNGDEDKSAVMIKASKPISKVKKGDKMRVDGIELEVDSHYVLIDHGTTKEMAIELFDAKADKDYQVRYFDDQVETTLEFYELQGEVMFVKKPAAKIEW